MGAFLLQPLAPPKFRTLWKSKVTAYPPRVSLKRETSETSEVPHSGEATLCFRPRGPSHKFLSGATQLGSTRDGHTAGRGHSGGSKGTSENTSPGDFRKENKQTRKPELELARACFTVG